MNNENNKTTSISASISTISATNTNAASTPSSSASLSSLPLPVSSYAASTSHFDATVNAIAAVVNASSHLPVTPPNAVVVVAVAVSSLAAAIIPDTPIVSIAGSTLSEITTTTTSTRTTPTPVPTTKETTTNKTTAKKESLNNKAQDSLLPLQSSSSLSASVKQPHRQMSVANSSVQGAVTNATNPAASAAANDNDHQTNSCTTSKGSSIAKQDSPSASSSITTEAASSLIQSVANTTASANKTDETNIASTENKSKDILSESWEERRLNEWDDSKLKDLLDEAYSYKNPRDKKNKSKTFLQLLKRVEHDEPSYPFRTITTRGSRNLSSSVTSNSYHHYQNPHYHSHSHNHNRTHHHHKQGGSLQDLLEIGLHETQLDCDPTFGTGIGGNQRTRRQNHNSRQKKYSSSVSSRQREGGSLPSNVNVTHQISGSGNELAAFMQQESTLSACSTGKASKKEQRRNAKATASCGPSSAETKDSGLTGTAVDSSPPSSLSEENSATPFNVAFVATGGDFIIDMGEPMMDIQQQQKILQSKGQDSTKQGQSFYERLTSIDKRLPRANLIASTKGSYFAPTSSHCYVDETVRFNTLERNGGTANNAPNAPTTVDAKFLPLDENYKACKSVLGVDGEKSPELLGKPKPNSSIYSKISSPASGSSVLGGTTNNIATLTQRQLDENGNALSELYQNASAVGVGGGGGTGTTMQINCVSPTAANPASAGILLTSCGGNNVSTSATVTIPPHPTSTTVSTSATITTYASGPSQAKAKAKKKSQQERNTKTVDVESVAGYRGKDPVEELVKYIESSGEGGGSTKSGDKRKERKKEKDKEKHQKLKKSNSLEELRSGAKMEVHELKRTAATTESNAVLLRQKSGSGGGGKQSKNNSSSVADINKNIEGKAANTNTRKSDRRSWGNEDLKYLEDQQNANDTVINEEKAVAGTTTSTTTQNPTKERKSAKGGATLATKDDKESKDRTAERNERNLTNNVINHNNNVQQQNEKLEKQDRSDKPDRVERRKRYDTPPNAVTIIDIVPMESSCPETAEFHVVTKKKKPKKPKVITNSEETSVTFNRTHNFTIQKSSTQSIPRYKYYQQEMNTQQHQPQHNSSAVGNVVTNSTSSSASHQHNTETYKNADKSRRKSTSSVPPSEKSDSSDLDSVHSLPIESTKANATKDNSQQKVKGAKTGHSALASNKSNPHAPISYADIARTNKEIADAAAAVSSNEATQFDTKNAENTVLDDKPIDDKLHANAALSSIKPQKSKKSQIKQDFPELVGPPSTSTVPVTYSQSLSTATNTTPNQTAGVSGSPASDASPSTLQPDMLTKSSLTPEQQTYPSVNPQVLQKSKSVENDTMICNSSATSYMAPLNSNSLDQQYPALEKTVKRHSSANIGVNYMTANQTSAFNFAAAAKQQISAISTEPTNLNCNKNSALTTSTNSNTQMTVPAANIATTSSITNTTTNSNNRKSKERSPPIATQNTTVDTTILKKSKKERQQHSLDATASQAKTSSAAASTSKKTSRSQLKSSSSLPLTTSTQTNPRPAVIILNDDRNSSGCAADNQFTFGDFNEDELKLFEDDISSNNNHVGDHENSLENQCISEDQNSDGGTLKSPVATYFNDSGASCENDMVNNSTSDMLLNSSIDASSPNTSFAINNHTSRGGGGTGGHMAAPGNNQSSDSGIYTDKSKSSSSSQHATRQSKQPSPTKEDNKLNTFLSNTKCASVHTSMDSLDPPPQQLETCNDIETAIIAAARAAAKSQQKQHQHQQFKNSNSSSNSSSFSSSSLSSTAPYHNSSNSRSYNQHGISIGSNNVSSYHHHQQHSSQQQQEPQYEDVDDDESFGNTPRSRSPSRPRRISIQYIPPTMASAFSTQQHNEIIVDFIGSAWEEIANSKVTKVYDGQ